MKANERKPITPKVGHYYINRGGGVYKCIKERKEPNEAVMRNRESGWTFIAKGCGIYPDGTIDWDHSTSGYFAKEEEPNK